MALLYRVNVVSSNGDIGAQDILSQILLKKKPECGTPKYPFLAYLKLIILQKLDTGI